MMMVVVEICVKRKSPKVSELHTNEFSFILFFFCFWWSTIKKHREKKVGNYDGMEWKSGAHPDNCPHQFVLYVEITERKNIAGFLCVIIISLVSSEL